MAEIINMPRLSDTMEEGTVAKWFKKVGDTVKEGEILVKNLCTSLCRSDIHTYQGKRVEN